MKDKVLKQLTNLGNQKDKEALMWFFKTGKGEYGEKDKFLGIKVPPLRDLAKKYYKSLSLEELNDLLKNEYHEVREFAIFCLVLKYKEYPNEVYDLYLSNLKYINNWDLVDQSASYILGKHLYDNDLNRSIIYDLASSNNLWKQRIAIVATHYFIKKNDFNDTLLIAEKYLDTQHDLIKKATGWMLREIGKKDEKILIDFLDKHLSKIPSVTFSYAIERLDKNTKVRLKEKRKN